MATVESNRTEQIISNFHLKALHLVLQSRIPHLSQQNHRYQNDSSNRPTKRERWFNLAIGDHPAVLETLNFRNRGSVSSDPMIVDVILSGGPSDSDSESILERWIVEYKRSNLGGGGGGDVYVTYKKAIVLFRSMYSMLRLLPAYKAFRMLSSSNQNYRFSLSYKVSSFVETSFSKAEEDGEQKRYCFSPVETQFGQIAVAVTYRSSLPEFDLQGSPLMQPRIITDYVGSPAADPLKSFPSSLRAMSLHNQVESAPLTRPHSWTSPAMAHHPSNRVLEMTAPGFSGRQIPQMMLQRTQSYSSRNKGIDLFSEHKLSPPFSPSPTPSPPMYPTNSPLRSRMQSETAPVSIPSRSSLPPPSPKSTKGDPGSAESPSDGRFCRKLEGFRMGELHSNLMTHTSQKGIRDGKDDQGIFSGIFSSCGSPRVGFSRSSSRLSSQDFADDPELCCPFVLDDIETSDSQNRNTEGKEGPGLHQPFMSSQDAAVGVLVQMLRSAPPLRHDPTYPSQSINSEPAEDVGSSCFYVSRKTSDALDELRSYREMKDMLLSHSENLTPDSAKRSQKQHISKP